MKLHLALILSSLSLVSSLSLAQDAKPASPPPQAPPPALITPEVHSDNSVTFRFRAPNAQEVKVTREGSPDPLPMQRDDAGVWTVNTAPRPPDYYGYSIVALNREHGARAGPAVAAVGIE